MVTRGTAETNTRLAGAPFELVGERLCLDFVNTELVRDRRRIDLLGGFPDLLRWCGAAGLVPGFRAAKMLARWSDGPDARRTFEEALRFRKLLRRMAARLPSDGAGVAQGTLNRINAILRHRAGDLVVRRTKQGYETAFVPLLGHPRELLVPIAESAAELLARDEPRLVKKCEGPLCILYFYDTTRNHARRWCSMAVCGNRAKVAAHYARQRRLALR